MSCKAFCEAKRRNYPTGCYSGAWLRHKVKRGTGDDWILREASFWGRATQTGPQDVDLILVKHCGVCGTADASWQSQLEDPGRCS